MPEQQLETVAQVLQERPGNVAIGTPPNEKVRMGPRVSMEQREHVQHQVQLLSDKCRLLCGAELSNLKLLDADVCRGAFYPPTLLLDEKSMEHGARP